MRNFSQESMHNIKRKKMKWKNFKHQKIMNITCVMEKKEQSKNRRIKDKVNR